MVRIDSLVRLSANETGETKCVVFVDSLETARKSLEPHLSTVVAAYPFIRAFGAGVYVHKLSDLASLPCVKAIAPHTTVSTCLKKTKDALGIAPVYNRIGYGENISAAVIDIGVTKVPLKLNRYFLSFQFYDQRIITVSTIK